MSRWRVELRAFWLAVQFFTRLPTPHFEGFQESWLNDAARWFPAVGWLVGLTSAATLSLAALFLPMPVAAGLALAAGALLTGAFHEDGLADTFDALGGQVDTQRALEIMKDSRIGSYGALALLLVTGLRWSALASLTPEAAAFSLLAVHPAARAASTALMARLAYVRDERGKSKPLAVSLGRGSLLTALLFGAAPALALAAATRSPALLAGLGGAALVHLGCARWYRRRLGGFTGDALGCAEQLSEAAFLLAVLAATGA